MLNEDQGIRLEPGRSGRRRSISTVSDMCGDVADHGVRVSAFNVEVGIWVVFGDAPDAVFLVPVSGPPQMLSQEAGDPRSVRRWRQDGHPHHPPSRAQATRPPSSPTTPQFPAPAIAVTTSNPCGRPSSHRPVRHDPPASSTSIRTRSRPTSARKVNAPPCREALCRTELVANSEATRIASSARSQLPSQAASAARYAGGSLPPQLS
jgi:hypothetical protein